MRPSASSRLPCASAIQAAAPSRLTSTSVAQYSFFAVFSVSRSRASSSTSFSAAAGSPLRAAPRARAKCVIASVNGNLLGRGSSFVASLQSPRSTRSAPASPRARRDRRAPGVPGHRGASSITLARVVVACELQVGVDHVVQRVQRVVGVVVLLRGHRPSAGWSRPIPSTRRRG